MRYIAGIDIGNSSTEVALATLNEAGTLTITHSALAETTGIKGTLRNVFGIQEALALVARGAGIAVSDISLIRINEATPVIGDVAMETITETIITESTMIGHNPKTPGGAGLGVGITITPQELLTRPADAPYILVVSSAFDFADIASVINASLRAGYQITGVILQRDDGVLVSNRLEKPLPIVDEVLYIDRIPLGMLAAIEVAVPGKGIGHQDVERLSELSRSNPVFAAGPEFFWQLGGVEELIKTIPAMKETIVRHIDEVRRQKEAEGFQSTGPQGRGISGEARGGRKIRGVILAQMRAEFQQVAARYEPG